MKRTKLSPDEIAAGLSGLATGWQLAGDAITRTVEFPSFLAAVDFITGLAPIAEELDHHPDLALSWRTVVITLSTHSSGGITALDLALATELDTLIDRFSSAN